MSAAPGEAAAPAGTLRTLLDLAWPLVISRAAQVVVGLADAVMVAHLGPEALAATTAGAVNTYAVFILPMGVVFLVSSFSSQLEGAGDRAGARRYAWHGLAVAGGAQAVALGLLPFVGPAVRLAPYAPGVHDAMAGYVAIRLLSTGAVVGLEALANHMGGLGDTRRPMLANVAAMVLNVGGNWLLIEGHLGLPALGVRGAAIASAVSTWLAFLGLLAVFVRHGRRAPAGPLRLAELGRLLRFGIPSGFNWFLEFMAFTVFINAVMGGLGTVPVAGFMAVIQVNSVAFMPSFALASAGAILVGQAIGAGHREAVPRLLAVTFGAAAAWQVAVGLGCLAAPGLVLAPFARDAGTAEAFLEAATAMLYVSVAWQLFDAAVAVLAEGLRAAGDTTAVLLARLAVGWFLFVPGSWATVRWLGAGPVAASGWLVVYLLVLSAVLLVRFRAGAWRRIVLVEPQAR
ncbi:MAG: MATE family efflux transporter [Anaeromyxobacter sp.]